MSMQAAERHAADPAPETMRDDSMSAAWTRHGRRVTVLQDAHSTYGLALRAIGSSEPVLRALAQSLPVVGEAGLRGAARLRPHAATAVSSGTAPLPGVRHRAHAPGQRRDARCHAPEAAAAGRRQRTADRFDAHVPVGRRGRPARAGPGRRATGMVLQGQWQHRRRLRAARSSRRRSRWTAARSRSWWACT